MLPNFWASPELRNRFEISFSYRHTRKYVDGLKSRSKLDFPVYPLHFPDPSNLLSLPDQGAGRFTRAVSVLARLTGTPIIIFYEIWVLRKLFIRLHPDILHINNGGYPAALSARVAAIAAKLAGIPSVIMAVNNRAVDYRRPARWLSYPMDRIVVGAVTKFVTGSNAAASQLKKVLRLNEGQCAPIHNGIALRPTTKTIEETRKRLGLEGFDGVIFGVVALMELRKGHRILLEALIKLRESTPDIKVLLEGDGPLAEDLRVFVADNQLSQYCIFVGEEQNIMDFMSLLDVLVLPSIDYEDFPNVILEAMGLGKPIIASRLAGIPEQIVDGENGLLVEPRNVDQLAAAMTRLLLDEKLRIRMGRAGWKRFQGCFTAEVAVNNYLSLYQSLIEN